jgi:hypothetical protein
VDLPRQHAARRRFIPRELILAAVGSYDLVEAYPDDKYLPSYQPVGRSTRRASRRRGSTTTPVCCGSSLTSSGVSPVDRRITSHPWERPLVDDAPAAIKGMSGSVHGLRGWHAGWARQGPAGRGHLPGRPHQQRPHRGQDHRASSDTAHAHVLPSRRATVSGSARGSLGVDAGPHAEPLAPRSPRV